MEKRGGPMSGEWYYIYELMASMLHSPNLDHYTYSDPLFIGETKIWSEQFLWLWNCNSSNDAHISYFNRVWPMT